MERYLRDSLLRDLKRKPVFLSGPRQVGKTTLARSLNENSEYLNYDSLDDRPRILKREWDRSKPLLILDEVHKLPKWKSWLKGIYDTERNAQPIIVTGSARLDLARKVGDSMAGRYFPHRLYPLDLKELKGHAPVEELYESLLRLGGFPEPFFGGSESERKRWQRTHLDIILRQDLLDLESPRQISSIETLVKLLQGRVGSTISYASLARDLQKDPKTVKHWLEVLENLYVIFKVTPYHRNVARSLLKEPKYYFYDIGRVEGDDGARLENLVALSLKKEIDFALDSLGMEADLRFLRLKQGTETDFVIVRGAAPELLIECKNADESLSPGLAYFKRLFPSAQAIQLVGRKIRGRTLPDGTEIRAAADWLTELPLSSRRSSGSPAR